MNPRIAKDIRLIAPAWLLTMALLIGASFLPVASKEWSVAIVVFGCLVIAASIFGAEFGFGTVPQVLTQPIDRHRIWRDKMLVLALGLASLTLTLLAIESATWPVAIVAAAAFCTVPFFSMVGRSTIGGIVLSIPIPGLIFVFGGLLALWLLAPAGELINEERLHFWTRAYFYVVLPAYCGLLFYLGYRRFLDFEVVGREPMHVRLPASMQTRIERLVSNFIPSTHDHLRSLVAKELHLQHNSTILFLLFVGFHLLAIAFIKLAHPRDPGDYFAALLFFYAATMPFVIGSPSIAEETNLGTRACQLTLPVSIRLQWFVKLSVVIVYTLLFAIAVPLLWLVIAWALGFGSFASDISSTFWLVCCSPVLLTLIAFYASSFSRDTLRALLAAFGLCAGMLFIVVSVGSLASYLVAPINNARVQRGGTPIIDGLITVWILLGLPLTCFIILLLRGSFKHFATLHHRRVWPDALAVFFSPILLFVLLLGLIIASNTLR